MMMDTIGKSITPVANTAATAGQIIPQRPRMVDLLTRTPPADVLRRRDLGGDLSERIRPPPRRWINSTARRASNTPT
jgi:hypothetical protein